MIDSGLIVEALRSRGHEVGEVIGVPSNAGDYEFVVDGETLSLTEARALMEEDDLRVAETIHEHGPLFGVPKDVE